MRTGVPFQANTGIRSHHHKMRCVRKWGFSPAKETGIMLKKYRLSHIARKNGLKGHAGKSLKHNKHTARYGTIFFVKVACSLEGSSKWFTDRVAMGCFALKGSTPASLRMFGRRKGKLRNGPDTFKRCFEGKNAISHTDKRSIERAGKENSQKNEAGISLKVGLKACRRLAPFLEDMPCNGWSSKMSEMCFRWRRAGYSCYARGGMNRLFQKKCQFTCFGKGQDRHKSRYYQSRRRYYSRHRKKLYNFARDYAIPHYAGYAAFFKQAMAAM